MAVKIQPNVGMQIRIGDNNSMVLEFTKLFEPKGPNQWRYEIPLNELRSDEIVTLLYALVYEAMKDHRAKLTRAISTLSARANINPLELSKETVNATECSS